MNWNYYQTLLDQKVADATYNYEHAEKKARESKATLDAVLKEKEQFNKAIVELMEEKK